jgi:hypothetical protein
MLSHSEGDKMTELRELIALEVSTYLIKPIPPKRKYTIKSCYSVSDSILKLISEQVKEIKNPYVRGDMDKLQMFVGFEKGINAVLKILKDN